jgi:hypothetical protein
MCRSRDACTELYATVAGVGEEMRAKMEPAGSETRDTERLAKEPGLRSTRRRRVRSGWTQAGMMELAVWGRRVGGVVEVLGLPFEEGGDVVVIAAGGDMMISSDLGWQEGCVCANMSV